MCIRLIILVLMAFNERNEPEVSGSGPRTYRWAGVLGLVVWM